MPFGLSIRDGVAFLHENGKDPIPLQEHYLSKYSRSIGICRMDVHATLTGEPLFSVRFDCNDHKALSLGTIAEMKKAKKDSYENVFVTFTWKGG